MSTATVTVMFTDLVDSTALMSRVGETPAEGLRREHFGLLRAAVAERNGREVKNLGDGLMVVFPSAADAVAAAVDVQRSFAHRNRRAAEPLSVRVGIALGDADVAEDDFFGVPVVQAARLCATAAGGEVLCTDIVRVLTGSRVDASFESVGELDLKGLGEPVPACRVRWSPVDASEVLPLPGRLAVAVTDRFVGRAAERERVLAAWKRATADGTSGVVLVSGEPGIGKTTLTAQLAASVHAEGATVVYGRCDEDLGIPYQPWIEALTQTIAQAPTEVLAAHVEDRGAHVARLVPALARRTGVEVPAGDDGDGDRFVLFGCVVDLLERVSGESAVLVVLDDLHWADRQSVQLLRHLATSAVAAPLLVVGTFRDTDVASGDPMSDLLAALHRVSTADRIALRGLDDADVLELLERTAGHEMDDQGVALRDAVLAETAGNPFFVNEILRHLAETGAIYQDATGRWVGDLDLATVGLPVSVTEVIGRRVATLGADTERLLGLAAVIGRDFDVTVLAAAADVDELDVVDRCDAAVTAAVLRTTDVVDRYTFAHALIERTLYEGMSPSRRARAHRSVAEAIEATCGADPSRAGELAHHWSAAVQPTDGAKALHYAQLAGDRALEQLAPDEALRWYTHALDLTDRVDAEPRRRAELLLGLGIARRQTGRAEHRRTLLDAAALADTLGHPDLHVRAALAGFRGFQSNVGQTDHEKLAVIERALELVGPSDSAERARLLVISAVERQLSGDLDHRIALADEAIGIARRLGDRSLLATVLLYGCAATRSPRTVRVRSDRMAEARSLLTDSTDPATAANVHGESRLTALDLGDRAAMRRDVESMRAATARAPEPVNGWMIAFHPVTDVILDGDLVTAEQMADAALAIGTESEQPDAFDIYAAQLANIRYHQGRLHELIPLMEEALRTNPQQVVYRAAIEQAHVRGGDHAVARRMLDEDMTTGLTVPENDSWGYHVGAWAEVAARVGHRDAAKVLHARLDPHRHILLNVQIAMSAATATLLGMLEHTLGRHDDAERSFAQGQEIHRRVESPMLVAFGEAHWAAMLLDRDLPGDAERARDLATNALGVAVAGGYLDTERIARDVLKRCPR